MGRAVSERNLSFWPDSPPGAAGDADESMAKLVSKQDMPWRADVAPKSAGNGAKPGTLRPVDRSSGEKWRRWSTVSNASTAATSEDDSTAAAADRDGSQDAPAAEAAERAPAGPAAAAAVAPGAAEELSRPGVGSQHTGIIFDWDDTLLPTSFIEDEIESCPAVCGIPTRLLRSLRGMLTPRGGGAVSENPPGYEALQRHAELVRRVLTLASGLGQVAIVTSAARPWVLKSAEKYLPGLDLAGLLREAKVSVYYASEQSCPGYGLELSRQIATKQRAISEFLRLDPARRGGGRGCTNVLSVGDSAAERYATRAAVLAGRPEAERRLCKTVQLMSRPSLEQLSDQLGTLEACLEALTFSVRDLDLRAAKPSDLIDQAEALPTV